MVVHRLVGMSTSEATNLPSQIGFLNMTETLLYSAALYFHIFIFLKSVEDTCSVTVTCLSLQFPELLNDDKESKPVCTFKANTITIIL